MTVDRVDEQTKRLAVSKFVVSELKVDSGEFHLECLRQSPLTLFDVACLAHEVDHGRENTVLYHNPKRQRGIFRNTAETQKHNPSLTLRVGIVTDAQLQRLRVPVEDIRGHWNIENSQHHVLDAILADDASRIRTVTASEISASVAQRAVNVLQRNNTVKDNIRGERFSVGWDEDVLE